MCVVFVLYIPPKQTVVKTAAMLTCLGDAIETAKNKYDDPYIIIGGDTNRRSIDGAVSDFPEIQMMQTGPTRGNAHLDVLASNINQHIDCETFFPLEKADSTGKSDHKTIVARAQIPRQHRFTKVAYFARKYTTRAEEEFGDELLRIDWQCIERENPTDTADALDKLLQEMYDKFFPLREIVSRRSDPPWFTKAVKRAIRNRKREFKRSGRSARWRKKKEKCERMILENKQRYIERIKAKVKDAGNMKSFYQSVNMLGCGQATERWTINSMYPGATDSHISEVAADFFNSISQEFDGLGSPVGNCAEKCPQMYQIAAKLKHMRKPKSTVRGDIDPRLVTKYADILAIPLHHLYQQIFTMLEWPGLWKTETVTLIPKNSLP